MVLKIQSPNFVFSLMDMLGIESDMACHRLNVNPSFLLIHQQNRDFQRGINKK